MSTDHELTTRKLTMAVGGVFSYAVQDPFGRIVGTIERFCDSYGKVTFMVRSVGYKTVAWHEHKTLKSAVSEVDSLRDWGAT